MPEPPKKKETQHKIVENYKLYEEIGAGQYGKVYRAIDTKTGDVVAIKTIPIEKFMNVPKLEEFTTNEIRTLGRINNPNVIKFIEMLKTTNNMYLVYEYCEGGTLEKLLFKKHHFSEAEALKYFKQIINAFKALYKENILHRDLKPSNILLHKDIIKIADFGFCKRLNSPYELTMTMVGSPVYMAPEILKGCAYTIKADIWSLGVALYEMLFGICPYEDQTLAGLIYQLDTQELIMRKDINKISANTEALLKKMLIKDYTTRMEWSELLNYQFNTEETENNTKPKIEGINKIDLGIVNKFDEVEQYKLDQKSIFNTLMKERNKVIFMIDVIGSILENNLNSKTPILAYILIKKANMLIQTIKKDISVENLSTKYSIMPQWNNFKFTQQFYGFSSRLNQEYDELIRTLQTFKQELQLLAESNQQIDSDFNDPDFKIEMINTNTINQSYCKNIIISYIEEIMDGINVYGRYTEDKYTLYTLHCINVLECDNIQDFFDKNIMESNTPLYDQEYFKGLYSAQYNSLKDIIKNKISQYKLLK